MCWGHAGSPLDGQFRPSSAQHSMFEELARGRSRGRFPYIPFSDCNQRTRRRALLREAVMSLKTIGTIAIPGAAGSAFDHAAFDLKSRRVFIAHTARDSI